MLCCGFNADEAPMATDVAGGKMDGGDYGGFALKRVRSPRLLRLGRNITTAELQSYACGGSQPIMGPNLLACASVS